MAKPQTALGQALNDKGYVARNVAFQIAISKFQNQGGEFGVAYAMLCAAYGRSSEGHGTAEREDHGTLADAAGRGAGRASLADKAVAAAPAPRPPRGASAIASVQPALAKSLFDSIVLPDGRRLGEVRWSECPMLAQRYQQLARILTACRNFAVPPDASTPLGEIVPERELREIIAATERLNDVQ